MSVTPVELLVAVFVLLAAGAVAGLAGAGFAVLATTGLAVFVAPARAVTLLLVPILAVNARLVGELDRSALRTCTVRFGPFLLATLAGTLAGMTLLTRLPDDALRLTVGLLVVAYALTAQRVVSIPGLAAVRTRGVRVGRVGRLAYGAVSGVVFGATNVGVQIVAYLEAQRLDRAVFVGVVAGVFLGISTLRIVAAVGLGLFPDATAVGVSAAGALPAVVGATLGARIRPAVPDRVSRRVLLGLFLVVGVRLTTTALGV